MRSFLEIRWLASAGFDVGLLKGPLMWNRAGGSFAFEVVLQALGTAQGRRYDVAPEQARLTARWGSRPAF